MSLIINHNTAALQTHRNLSLSGSSMAKSIEKLSSGYKINVGADDPSGLVISEQLRSQIAGLERAVRNSSEASNLIGIAEGALNEMNNILKKMRALAIHASNDGITSPDQVAADQGEMDSGLATLNRIADTTRYSDQYLLNGSKELVYDIRTEVNDPMDHQLLDPSLTRVDQVFKRDGVVMSIGYTGRVSDSQTNSKDSAQRAYFEADGANSSCQVSNGFLTGDQKFTLTGTRGSRLFDFSKGKHIGSVVAGINNSKDSTGIGATLIFASDTRVDKSLHGCVSGPVYPNTAATPMNVSPPNYIYKSGDVQIYGAGMNNANTAAISNFTMTPKASESFKVGYNCDGDGKIYAKVIDKSTNSIEYYKDKDCTMLIGKGGKDFFAATNNSGIPSSPTQNLDGVFIELTDKAENLDVYEIAVIGQKMDNLKDISVNGIPGWADMSSAIMSGVNLGKNTSPEGQIYYKYTPMTMDDQGNVKTFRVEAFTDSSREPKYLVASSGVVENTAGGRNGQTVRLESRPLSNGEDSGLNITLNMPKAGLPKPLGAGDMPKDIIEGEVNFTNLGMRIYAEGYGSAETIRIQNETGELFYRYRESDTLEKVMIKPDDTVQIAGQDAKFSLNGAPVYTTGLIANTTTPDFSGQLVFNAGKLGQTTLAVAGYDEGKLFSKATSIQGIEENEDRIWKERREFEPQALHITHNNLVGSDSQPVTLYLDFSQLEASVEARIPEGQIGAKQVTAQYDKANGQLIIRPNFIVPAASISIPMDPAKLAQGIHVTDPALKGLYVRTAGTVDVTKSSAATATRPIEVKHGNVLLETYTYATNPRTNTGETISEFVGGMQFQLGNTEGDQDRTIYSIPSMAMSNLGRIEYNNKDYCIQDVLGGGPASLSKDPILAMRILAKAVDDVSGLRARLGAFQANMLQTNINSLEVAIENITKTESAIRDTDMAAESTEFTRFQIMQQAGTSMLAQANQISQNVLSLLQ